MNIPSPEISVLVVPGWIAKETQMCKAVSEASVAVSGDLVHVSTALT